MERYSIDPFSLLDPDINEQWGKWILAEEITRHGLNWKAVGKHHSPDPERGRQYVWFVCHTMRAKEPPKLQRRPHMPSKKRIL
jgi:hypothetical protein